MAARAGLLTPYLWRQRVGVVRTHLRGAILDIGCSAGPMAAEIDPQFYVGFDIDQIAIDQARQRFPLHDFRTTLPVGQVFDTVIALAVLEHLPDPTKELTAWKSVLHSDGHMVLTTPHPMARRIHDIGAGIGLFSRHASEDHEDFLDVMAMHEVAQRAGMEIGSHRRFMFGVNQLFVLRTVH